MTSKTDWEDLLTRVHNLPPTTYRMSDSASRVFKRYREWHHEVIDAERILKGNPVYMTALGKLEGTCARLMLVYHLIEDATSNTISEQTAKLACAMMQGYLIPMLRATYGRIGGLMEDTYSEWIIDHIVQNATVETTISLSEIKRSSRRQVEKLNWQDWQINEEIRATMRELAEHNYVVLLEERGKHAVWSINPAIAETFKEYRASVIKAKQDIFDRIHSFRPDYVPTYKAKGA